MTEDTLARLAAHRRTLNLVGQWEVPEGIFLSVSWTKERRIVLAVSCLGLGDAVETIIGAEFRDREESDATLDLLAKLLMARAVRAYEEKDVGEDARLDAALAEVSAKFRDAIACDGIGRDG